MGGVPASPEPDGHEFAAWIRPHWAAMAVTAARIAGLDDRDDALQDALVSAWRYQGSFDPDRGTARAWLVAVTANAARKLARRRVRSFHQPADALAAASGSAVAGTIDPVHLDVERAIAALPDRQRLAVTLFYFAGLSLHETAAVMGCAEGTVKATLAAARANLRNRLKDNES